MHIKYFNDTDTALIKFMEGGAYETRELSEDVYADLDKRGNLVSLTIEHAEERAGMPEVEFEEVRDQ